MGRLRTAWRRAKVRAEAERQGATPEQALLAADVLYPYSWTVQPNMVVLEDGDNVDILVERP